MSTMRPSRAFTLVELLVVIAIVGILVGLLVTAVMGAGDSAQRAKLQKMIGEIEAATGIYQTEFGSVPPFGETSYDVYDSSITNADYDDTSTFTFIDRKLTADFDTEETMDQMIYIFLNGFGDNTIWDNARRKTVSAPLTFPDKAFVEPSPSSDPKDYRLKNPWYDADNPDDGVIHYRGEQSGGTVLGLPSGVSHSTLQKDIYIWSEGDAEGTEENIIKNWK